MRVCNGASIRCVIGDQGVTQSDALSCAVSIVERATRSYDGVVILQDHYALHWGRLAVGPMAPERRATACCIAPYSPHTIPEFFAGSTTQLLQVIRADLPIMR